MLETLDTQTVDLLLLDMRMPVLDGLSVLALLQDEIHRNGLQVTQLFWGLWLLPFGWLYLVNRVYYAYEDARTPFFFQVVVTIIATIFNLIAYAAPVTSTGIWVGVGQTVSNLVGAILGFRAADKASLDVVHVYGGGRWTQLRKVRVIAALPAILNALQIAVPTAFLGAVLGEYLGAITAGVGPTLIRLQGQLDSAGVWSVFLLCAVFALVAYGLFGLLIRLVTPWVAGKAV